MLTKILVFVMSALLSALAFAVEVNKADQSELDSVKGIGPAISKRIVDERAKNGPFKDWADFEKRVKGVGDKSAAKMSESGLTVNGRTMSGASAAAGAAKSEKEKGPTSRASSDKTGGKASSSGSDSRPAAASGTAAKAGDKKEGSPR